VIDLKFCTQIIGLSLHQMEHYSQKIISSPIMLKNSMGRVPLKYTLICSFIVIEYDVFILNSIISKMERKVNFFINQGKKHLSVTV
jgi:hypothetical protein